MHYKIAIINIEKIKKEVMQRKASPYPAFKKLSAGVIVKFDICE